MNKQGMAAFTRNHGSSISCEEVIKCVLEISDEGWNIYHHIINHGPVRVEEIATFLRKDRSTAYRELQKLIDCGVCYKESNNLREGGYYYLYHSNPIDELMKETETCIDQIYTMLKEAVKMNLKPLSDNRPDEPEAWPTDRSK